MLKTLPPPTEMYDALLRADSRYDGVFVTAVKTTGIFCRPSCSAKKPRRENVDFYLNPRDALHAGYRPCLRCRPMDSAEPPEWLRDLLEQIEAQPARRWRDQDLRALGLEPERVRRWFQKTHGMTFHAYSRARRIGLALGQIRDGRDITRAAFDQGYESLSAFNEAFQQITGTTPARGRDAVPLYLSRLNTPLGPMLAGATDDGLCLLEFVDRRMLPTELEQIAAALDCTALPGHNPITRQTEQEMRAYFTGELRAFTVPLAPVGTPFQQRVWTILQGIPYATTRSYMQQADLLGNRAAIRAVARANGDNRIAIIVPCHRVIGADGKLTGYGGGLWRKRWLLDHEAHHAGLLLTPPALPIGIVG